MGNLEPPPLFFSLHGCAGGGGFPCPPFGIVCIQNLPIFLILSGGAVLAALKRAQIQDCPIVAAWKSAVCSVQCAVCSVQCSVCSVQCAVCSNPKSPNISHLIWQCGCGGPEKGPDTGLSHCVILENGSVQCAVCSVQCAVYSVKCAVLNMLCAV